MCNIYRELFRGFGMMGTASMHVYEGDPAFDENNLPVREGMRRSPLENATASLT
jgi:hypothetical protein